MRATFAVGIFEACDALREALVELVTLGYRQEHLILVRPTHDAVTAVVKPPPPVDIGKLVTPLDGRLLPPPDRVDLNDGEAADHEPQDVFMVRDMKSWLPEQNYDALANALHERNKVLFVRMHENRQLAPTCSVLLAHCTQHVNTHEVVLPVQGLR